MLSVDDILQPENVSYTDNVWTWAVAHMLHKGEDWQITTITDTAPIEIVFLSKGEHLTDYLLSGNTAQNGVPSPDNPVDVVGCGERTENLFDWSTVTTGYRITWATGVLIEDKAAIMSDYIRVSPGIYRADASFNLVGYDANKAYVGTYDPISKTFRKEYVSKTSFYDLTNANVAYVKLMSFSATDTLSASTMLNSGRVAIPYESYGFKLPITVNGATYPIYLGQVPTMRQIRKIVLTGEETWYKSNTGIADRAFFATQLTSDSVIESAGLCTHFVRAAVYTATTDSGFVVTSVGGLRIRTPDVATLSLDEFKQWLVAQYANGTPVTVWYVLATEEIGIVNEPLMKIGYYADTISMAQAAVTIPTVAGANTLTVGTTVQPSSMSITGRIREAADV